MPNTINQGSANSIAYYPAAGTDIDDAGTELTWDNNSNRLTLNKSYTSASDSALTIIHAGNSTAAPPIYLARARGTQQIPSLVQSGDNLPVISFLGRGTTTYRTAAYIGARINGSTINNTSMPADIVFGTNNGSTVVDRVKINKDGVLEINSIKDFSGGTLTINPGSSLNLGTANKIEISDGSTGQLLSKGSNGKLAWVAASSGGNPFNQNLNTTDNVTFNSVSAKSIVFNGTGPVTIDSGNDLRFTATGNITFNGNSLPVTIDNLTDVVVSSPVAGQVLKYNGTNWVNDTDISSGSGSGSLQTRTNISATVSSLAANTDGNINLTAFKGYALYKMTVSSNAWVRLYTSAASRTADQSRLVSADPAPGSGVLAEVVTTASNQTITFSPAIYCFNDESTVNSSAYIRVKNLGSSTTNITITLTVLQLEA